MKLWLFALAGVVLSTAAVAAAAAPKPLEVVPRVDIQRYLGTWYEIATIPQRFQKGCVGVTAHYSLRPDGALEVVNVCRKDRLDAPPRSIRGKAWIVDKTTNAKLKVRFFWPFAGAYWIIELDPDYGWAVVGHPDRSYYWILSRTPQMEPAVYDDLIRRAAAKGYDTTRIKKTLQPS